MYLSKTSVNNNSLLLILISIFMLVSCGGEDFGGEGQFNITATGDFNRRPTIFLLGDSTITLDVGETYTELGAQGDDTEDGNISSQIVIDNSSVDTSQVGTYFVTYNLSDSEGVAAREVVRMVIVQETTVNQAPTITLEGPATVTLIVGSPYNEPGAVGSDVEDGDISDHIVIDHSAVDTNTLGTYSVTYNLTDSQGAQADSVTRTVIVIADTACVDCTAVNIRCVGPAQEYDTDQGASVQEAFDAAFNDTQPGDTIKIRGGVYKNTDYDNTFLLIANSGTASAPITIEPFEGESVLIEGFGFAEGTTPPSNPNERLVSVTGDYIHIRGIEIASASRSGLRVTGSFGLFEDIIVRDSWLSNVSVVANVGGPGNETEGNVLRRIESFRSRHGTGIGIGISSQDSDKNLVKDTLIENCISYNNGFQPDGQKVPGIPGDGAGGGNSDGMGTTKFCHDDGTGRDNNLPVENLCPGTVFRNNIVWHNADDGMDVSAGSGSLLENNISFNNGPEGNMGFKVLREVLGGLSFIGNIAMSNGDSSGNGNGFEIRHDENAGLSYLYHNLSIDNDKGGIVLDTVSGVSESLVYNNLSIDNAFFDLENEAGAQYLTNWTAATGDPQLVNRSFNKTSVLTNFDPSWSIAEKHNYILQQFINAFSLDESSPLIDAGTFIPHVHCERADDDATDPMPADADCRHWSGSAPDIGVYEASADSSGGNPAAPTLSGYGTDSQFGGGPGSEICTVTHTNDSGVGSLRDCVENRNGPVANPTPRTIVFATSGTIELASNLRFRQPYLTVDGLSAPEPGITIKKPEGNGQVGTTDIVTWPANNTCGHDLLIQGLRFQGVWSRDNDNSLENTAVLSVDGENIPGCMKNIAIWRNTYINAQDSAGNFWGSVKNATFAYNFILYNYHPQSISHFPGDEAGQEAQYLSIHHNIYAYVHERIPNIRGNVWDVNIEQNIFHQWDAFGFAGGYATKFRCRNDGCPQRINLIANHWTSASPNLTQALNFEDAADTAQVYSHNNRLPLEETEGGTAPAAFPRTDTVFLYAQENLVSHMFPYIGHPYTTDEEAAVKGEIANQFILEI